MKTSSILVTGISGRLGRQVVEHLLNQHSGPIIGTTRTPEKHTDLVARGVDVRYADFDDRRSVVSAFAGAARILIISTNAIGHSDRRIVQHTNAIEAAKEVGTKHLVYTSFIQKKGATSSAIQADHIATERALEASGIGYTCLRNAFYSDMLLVDLKGCIASGHLYSSAGEGRIPYVAHQDCALAAATALAGTGSQKCILDITGPAALNAQDLSAIASEVFCKTITYVPVTAEVQLQRLIKKGTPAPTASILVEVERWVSHGALDITSKDFSLLTGREAMSVKEFLIANRTLLM